MTASFNFDQLRPRNDLDEFATVLDRKDGIRRAVDNEKRLSKMGKLALLLISAGNHEVVGITCELLLVINLKLFYLIVKRNLLLSIIGAMPDILIRKPMNTK